MKNVVEFVVSDLPVYGTVEARIYKTAGDKDPKCTIYNHPELQDPKVKATMEDLLRILEDRAAYSDARYEGDDLVFNIHADRNTKDTSSMFCDAIIKFKDYNNYRKRVDDMERAMNMPVSEFTTEKDKIGAVLPYEDFFITLRRFISTIELSKAKLDLNSQIYEEQEQARKESSVINQIKKIIVSRENKYVNKIIHPSDAAKKVLNSVAIVGVSAAAIAGVANLAPEPNTYADLPSPESLNGYSTLTEEEREAVIANSEENLGHTEEVTTEDVANISREYKVDPEFVLHLKESGLNYTQIVNQLEDINNTVNESQKQR